jgi:sulfite exporter TauE/SafE
LGVVAATAAGLISRWGQQVAMLKPLWMMAQLGMVLLGGFMLLRGVMPASLEQAGKGLYLRARSGWLARSAGWPPALRKVWPFLAGLAWAVLPCGLLYSALMVAALASRPWEGGLVMLAFALPSALGVWAAPAMLRWLKGPREQGALRSAGGAVPVIWMRADDPPAEARPPSVKDASLRKPLTGWAPVWLDQQLAVRVAGLGLAAMAAWALWHQLWAQWQAWCA